MRLFRWPGRRNNTPERVSAYIDGELSGEDLARFESELADSPELREAIDDERALKGLLRATLPEVAAPRSFALTPEMVGIPLPAAPRPWFSPGAAKFAQAAAALAIVGFVTLTVVDLTGDGSGVDRQASQAAPASLESAGAEPMSEDAKDMAPQATPGEAPQPPGDEASRDGDDFRAAGTDAPTTPFAETPAEDEGISTLRLAQVAALALALVSIGVFFVARRSPSLSRK